MIFLGNSHCSIVLMFFGGRKAVANRDAKFLMYGILTPICHVKIWVFPRVGVPQNGWFISWKTLLKWVIWVYPYFGKHPYDLTRKSDILWLCPRRIWRSCRSLINIGIRRWVLITWSTSDGWQGDGFVKDAHQRDGKIQICWEFIR